MRWLARLGVLPRITFDQEAFEDYLDRTARHDNETASLSEWGHASEAPT